MKVFTLSSIFSFAVSSGKRIVQPAALKCPPPLKIEHTSATFTYSFERSDILTPSSISLINMLSLAAELPYYFSGDSPAPSSEKAWLSFFLLFLSSGQMPRFTP